MGRYGFTPPPSQARLFLAAARSFIGAPFRLYGRDPATGLDCVGLVLASLTATGQKVPSITGYTRHFCDESAVQHWAAAAGFTDTNEPPAPGDVVLARLSPVQWHLLIAAENAAFIHAHGSLGRVVSSPLPAEWDIARTFRLLPF